MSLRQLFISIALSACAAAPLSASAGKVPLSEAAMAEIHGGLAVESFTNPSASFQVVSRDNMELSGSIVESLNADNIKNIGKLALRSLGVAKICKETRPAFDAN